MVGFVLGGLGEDGREGMGSLQLVIGNDHEGRRVIQMESRLLSVGFSSTGGEGAIGLFEEAGDCVTTRLKW